MLMEDRDDPSCILWKRIVAFPIVGARATRRQGRGNLEIVQTSVAVYIGRSLMLELR